MTPADPLVLFMPSGKRGRFPMGTPVLDAARQLGVYVESVCGGRATCGRCQVEVQEGNFAKHKIVSSNDHISVRGAKELRYAEVREIAPNRRLSCSATIQGDLVIDVPQDTVVNAQVIRKAVGDRVIERHPAVHLCYVEIEEPDMHKPLGDMDRLKLSARKRLGIQGLGGGFLSAAARPENPAPGQLERHRRHPQGRGQRRPAHYRAVARPAQ